jgi:hypothetical protein
MQRGWSEEIGRNHCGVPPLSYGNLLSLSHHFLWHLVGMHDGIVFEPWWISIVRSHFDLDLVSSFHV